MILVDVTALLKSELHMINMENDALKLEDKQLRTQLNEKMKLHESNKEKV